MAAKLIVTVIVILLHGSVPNCAFHPLDLPVGPWMVWLGLAMLGFVCGADHVESHWPGIGRVTVAWLLTKLDAIVRQDSVDLVSYGFEHGL